MKHSKTFCFHFSHLIITLYTCDKCCVCYWQPKRSFLLFYTANWLHRWEREITISLRQIMFSNWFVLSFKYFFVFSPLLKIIVSIHRKPKLIVYDVLNWKIIMQLTDSNLFLRHSFETCVSVVVIFIIIFLPQKVVTGNLQNNRGLFYI